jgi:uncharacterized protein (TIGR03000 family)
MYSVVLLMALSGGAEAPDCHKDRCHGCSGSCGGYVVTSCGGCYGGGYCGGGCSGSCHGGRRFGHKHGGHGCHGCTGYSVCGGYCGGGYCGGGYCGGCHGAVIISPCAGGVPCGGAVMPGSMAPPAGEKLKEMPKEKGKEEVSAPATIVLSLPADAKVSINGVVTTSTSATRTFVTPELAPTTEFEYTLSAQIVRDGKTLSVTENVTVRAGQETRVNIGTEQFTALAVAAK